MIEGNEIKKLCRLLPGFLFGYIEIPCKNLKILKHGQVRIQAVLLLTDPNAGFDLAPIPGNIKVKDLQAPAAHGRETINHPDACGLSRAIGAQNPEAFTPFHLKRNPVDSNKAI